MSRREWKFLLDDILEAIGKVQNYVAGSSFEGFEDDSKTIDAVVRNFIIVGEAASHIPSTIVEKHPNVPWRLMADMRNFAVHEYWGVDSSVLWKTIHEDLPPLVLQLQTVKSSQE